MGLAEPKLRRICVFCGAHVGRRPEYRQAAEELGRTLAFHGIGVVYGGGNIGLMGALADAVLAAHGEVIGVIPEALRKKELAHATATSMHVVGSMHERKQRMADLADAFIALPGGIGTLEELFETWTWLQLAFHDKPVGLLNVAGFFDRLLQFLDEVTAQEFLRPEHRDWLLVDTEVPSLLEKLNRFQPQRLDRWWTPPPTEDLR